MMRAAVVLLLVVGSVAYADDPPWKQGVTAEQQAAAKKLLDEGNELLLQHDYPSALAKYQDAIKQWDHPGIRFNIVRCLVQLDRTLEAVENLDVALKYGAAPLDETVYEEALGYQKLLANQVATLDVTCKQHMDVTVDGQPFGSCPGTSHQRILPGHHQIVGKQQGFLTHTFDLVVLGGTHETVSVALDPLGDNGRIVHRWRTWVPWTVVASGIVIGAAGGVLDARALANRDTYNTALTKCGTDGCDPDYRTHLKDTALLENRAAISLFVVGGAALAAGGALVYMNRGRVVYPKQTEQIMPSASVTPTSATVGISGAF